MATTVQSTTVAEVARAYIEAISDRDLDRAIAMWQPGGRETVHGQVDTTAPDGARAFLQGILDAFPDLSFEIIAQTTEGERSWIRSRLTGTFAGPGDFNGFAPNGARVDLELIDCLVVRDGKIAENDAYADGLTIARQLGAMPAAGSKAEERMAKAFNAGTRLKSRMTGPLEEVGEGVWLLRGGFPEKTMNVYLVRDGDGVLAFDAGIKSMTTAIAREAAALGGLTRVVLGHGHQDHRGAAPGLGVPVYCHPADRAIAEGDGGFSTFQLDKLPVHGRIAYPRLLKWWDGGPVEIAGTVEEGEDIAGFEVVHLPGHADGMIGLWRASDRLALTSDCFYTIDPLSGRKGAPRVPLAAFNLDTEQARASVRKLAALEPAAAWPGHAEPVTGDVREQLERAADTT
jgi:glyoxylase-like metal-dependent hydrolase (beta-lactamase superfamily II)/predicted ester cyclase